MLTFRAGVLFALVASVGQAQQAAVVKSPEVDADGRVTFRLRAPNAREVAVAGDIGRLEMSRDARGVWSASTGSLAPDLYQYRFIVDSVGLMDPVNPLIKPNLLTPSSVVHVRGPASLPWEVGDGPHGVVHRHHYRSRVVGDERDFYVYTPPGYDRATSRRYPVLYLLHGFSDDADGWTSPVGRANVILDNLIAAGKARPMLVVMPLGYGAPDMLASGPPGTPRPPDLRVRNARKFGEALLGEVIPTVERDYRVANDAGSRAIAGLSMGGFEALYVGLSNPNKFAWVGGFSSALVDAAASFPALDANTSSKLRLVWIACGTEDGLIGANRTFREWLATQNVRHTAIETPGAHNWLVWRRNLAAFAPLLFRPAVIP